MNTENWYKVDNVAKVFLATHNERDTRSLRVSCTLTEPIKPELLQKAELSEEERQLAERVIQELKGEQQHEFE